MENNFNFNFSLAKSKPSLQNNKVNYGLNLSSLKNKQDNEKYIFAKNLQEEFKRNYIDSGVKSVSNYVVKKGDTLSHIAVNTLKSNGEKITNSAINLMIKKIANENNIKNIDLIFPGQKLNIFRENSKVQVNTLNKNRNSEPIYTIGSIEKKEDLDKHRNTNSNFNSDVSSAITKLKKTKNVGLENIAATSFFSNPPKQSNYLLNLTLERAAEKGYLNIDEMSAVRKKINFMAQRYNFRPDDFARVALMESDGFNPKATNGNCHGIIQFCDGDDRGAASIGLSHEPKKILELGVLDQLDLVSQYFEDTDLKSYKPPSLDVLYLTILSPNARSVKDLNEPLPVAGPQASILHVGGSGENPITKASIRRGLIQHAWSTLASFSSEKIKNSVTSPVALSSDSILKVRK